MSEVDRRRQIGLAVAAGQIDRGAMPGLLGAYRGQEAGKGGAGQIQAGRAATVWPPDSFRASRPRRPHASWTSFADFWPPATPASHKPYWRATRRPTSGCWARGDSGAGRTILSGQPGKRISHLAAGQSAGIRALQPEQSQPFVRIVEATYWQTPRLPGTERRGDVEDVLAGYRASGVFDAGRWLLVRHEGVDVGCLLLSDFPEHGNLELCYMGVRRARERLGGPHRAVCAMACPLAGRSRLVLAVDATNGPALKQYAAAGFQAWVQRTAYVKVFG